MPLRMLFYLAILYQGIVSRDAIYRKKTIPIPAPRFFGFYNGLGECPEIVTVRLSDAFPKGAKSDIDLTVTIHDIHYPRQAKLLRDCRPVHDYSFFIDRIRQNERDGQRRDAAVEEALRYCIKNDIMKVFLEKHQREVFDMVSLVWNEDDARESYIAQGREQGIEQGQAGMVRNLLAENMPLTLIAKVSGWTEDRIRALESQTEQ